MITTRPLCSLSLSVCLSLPCSFHFFPSPYLPSLSPLLLSLPPDFRWVHCLPERLTTHRQFSLIELRSLRTSALRFNLFWPERGACTPSLYHYIRGMVRRHRGGRGGRSDPVIILMPPSIEHQTGYRVMVMEWKADWDFTKLIRPQERAGLRRCVGLRTRRETGGWVWKRRVRIGSVHWTVKRDRKEVFFFFFFFFFFF